MSKRTVFGAMLVFVVVITSVGFAEDTNLRTFIATGKFEKTAIDTAKLPADADKDIYSYQLIASKLYLYTQEIPAGILTIELFFIETQIREPGQRLMLIGVNGTPVDVQFDVVKKAGGAWKPCKFTAICNHPGGTLIIMLDGLKLPAVVSGIQVRDVSGKVLAADTAGKMKGDRIQALDARSYPYRQIQVGQQPFFNVDHSPVGAYATFIYGAEASGGVTVNTHNAGEGIAAHDGVLIAIRQGKTVKWMPFYRPRQPVPLSASSIAANEVKHTLSACTDQWEIPMGVSWTHYSPTRSMQDWEKAAVEQQQQFVLPATWMVVDFDNSAGREPLEFYFSLQQKAKSSDWKDFEGYYIADNSAIAVKKGQAELLTAAQVRSAIGFDQANCAFRVTVEPGTKKQVTFTLAHYIDKEVSKLAGKGLHYYYTQWWKGFEDVFNAAQKMYPDAVKACEALDTKLKEAAVGDQRKFISAQALHTYRYNTILLRDPDARPVWIVEEGECQMINTMDLTVDMMFYELMVHPWTVRNVLDQYLAHYAFEDELFDPADPEKKRFPGGLVFYHDCGWGLYFFDSKGRPCHGSPMNNEELLNWILCSGLYVKATGDRDWLKSRHDAMVRALRSMQARDHRDPARRDGITSYNGMYPVEGQGLDTKEITTYDAMDHSLQQPYESLYLSVKSFGTYLVMQRLFEMLGDKPMAQECRTAAELTARGVAGKFDSTAGVFPATFDGSSRSRILPAVEGLIYPYMMGDATLVAADGPYGDLIGKLRQHIDTVLKPGICIDAETGGWILSDSSGTTWQSKVYLCQFIVENILGIRDDRTRGRVDDAHVAYQMLGSPAVGWTCQIYNNSAHNAFGCRHYPRGVVSSLWWLPFETKK